jgi:Short C-terminal domain
VRIALARGIVVVAVLLVIVSLLAGFIRFQALDTDTVSETASELIADKQIRDEVAASLVDQLYANVDVQAELEQRLPPDQKGLAGPAAAGLRELSDRAAVRMLERPRVQALWVNTVTRAHRQLIDVLEDDTGPVSTEEGVVVLDLQPLMIQLGERVAVIGDVAERFGPDAGRIEIMQADQLETAQNVTQVLKILGSWLWVLPIVLFGVALWIARGRRLSILRLIAFGSILAGFLVLVVRRLAGSYIVDDLVQSETVRPAVQDAWDILTAQLRDGGLTLVGLGVIVLVAAWIGGSSESAVGTRRALAPYLARPEIAFGAAALLFLLLLWWQPTVQTSRVQLMVVAAVVLAVGVELLRRETAREVPEPAAADPMGALKRTFGRTRRAGGSGEDRLSKLERLSRLHEQGELSDEEFAAEKAALGKG